MTYLDEPRDDARILKASETANFGQGASFTLANRLARLLWTVAWTLLARWTPGIMSPWRVILLNCFGARISRQAAVAASARIWFPANLEMGPYSTLGPGVDCYNMALITIGARTIVSQGAVLCAGSHEIRDPSFQLIARSIRIGDDVWIAAQAFVAPGVRAGNGSVLSARACAFADLEPWMVYRGNPAVAIKQRFLASVTVSPSHAGSAG